MSEWADIPLPSETNRPRSATESLERLVNLYAQKKKVRRPGESEFSLYSDPGLVEWASVGDGPIRGLHKAFDYVWAVSGDELYAVQIGSLASHFIGNIDGTGPVSMTDNGFHVVIATGGNSYAAPSDLSPPITISIYGFSSVTYQDGYVIAVLGNTEQVYISALDDATTWSGLDFTSTDAKPDSAVAVISSQREAWVLGQETTEILANTGAAAFPFQRSSYFERGCLAPRSCALADTSIFWLDHEKQVRQSQGYQPVRISTPAIEYMISQETSPETAEGFVYNSGGHTNYVLNFAGLSLVFNLSTGLWHERKSFGIDRWRAQAHCRVQADTHLVGDYANGTIWELDQNTYAEGDEILEREIIHPPVTAGGVPLFIHELEYDMQTGVGLTSGQGSDPVLMIDWTDNDGANWSTSRELSLGAMGNRRERVRTARCGSTRNRSIRARVTDPVNVVFHGARMRAEGGVQ